MRSEEVGSRAVAAAAAAAVVVVAVVVVDAAAVLFPSSSLDALSVHVGRGREGGGGAVERPRGRSIKGCGGARGEGGVHLWRRNPEDLSKDALAEPEGERTW